MFGATSRVGQIVPASVPVLRLPGIEEAIVRQETKLFQQAYQVLLDTLLSCLALKEAPLCTVSVVCILVPLLDQALQELDRIALYSDIPRFSDTVVQIEQLGHNQLGSSCGIWPEREMQHVLPMSQGDGPAEPIEQFLKQVGISDAGLLLRVSHKMRQSDRGNVFERHLKAGNGCLVSFLTCL